MKYCLIAIAFLLSSCAFDQTIEYRIEPALQVHVDNFFNEAQARGVDISHENLIVEFGITGYTGLTHKRGHQRVITIDHSITSESDPKIELVIFHEMGHALLGLGHIEGVDAIMNAHPRLSLLATDSIRRSILISELIFKNR